MGIQIIKSFHDPYDFQTACHQAVAAKNPDLFLHHAVESIVISGVCPNNAKHQVACIFRTSTSSNSYYYYSDHVCLDPDCDYQDSEEDSTGDCGSGPSCETVACLICDRARYL
jgi:hypothetical protein